MFKHKDLLLNLITRDLKLKYKGTILGFFWSLVNPLIKLLVFTWVFKIILNTQIPNYTMHLLAGLLPYQFFTTSLNSSVNAFTSNSNFISKISFPKYLLVLSIVGYNAVVFLMTLIIAISGMFFYDIPFGLETLMILVALALQIILLIGLGLIVSYLNVKYHDTSHFIEIVTMVLLWLTPIFYSWEKIPEQYMYLISLNPFALIVNLYQFAIVKQDLVVNPYIGLSLIALIFLVGLLTYKKKSKIIAEWV